MTYRAPFVDLPSHWESLRDEALPVIEDLLSRGQLILREELAHFETQFAAFCGTRHAVGVNSCTDGMFFALKAAGVGPGDEVITVAHTFVATLAAIVHTGATPVLVDVAMEDHLMDVSLVEQAITPRTRAILPVHLNGRVCDMDELMSLASEKGLAVIEDAAQSAGASLSDRRAGSFGLAGAFSLYPMKLLGAFGDGGIVVTDDDDVCRKVRVLRDHGQDRRTGEIITYGYNSRLDNLQAAILSVKLRHLPRWIEHRRRLAAIYHEGLSPLAEIILPPAPADAARFDVYQNYVVREPGRRDLLAKHLDQAGVETLISWATPLHRRPKLGLDGFDLPNTERLCESVLSLPMNPEVTDEQARYTIEAVASFYE